MDSNSALNRASPVSSQMAAHRDAGDDTENQNVLMTSLVS
jgi:hypothetical protein